VARQSWRSPDPNLRRRVSCGYGLGSASLYRDDSQRNASGR
jgi:hypothetical protein